MDSHVYNHLINNEGSLEMEAKGCCFQILVTVQLDMDNHMEKKISS